MDKGTVVHAFQGAGKLLAILLCLSVAAGCRKTDPSLPADNAARGKPLLIGLIPEQDIFKQIERYEPLAGYLSSRTGKQVRLKILQRYGNIINNFRSAGLDGAFFGSFTYALAHERLWVDVIARPVALDNTSSYHGLIFARADSGIRSIRDMRGKKFAFVDKATTAGFLLPLEYFSKSGVRDYRNHFRGTYFAGTHEYAIYDVLNGKADAGAAKNTEFDRLAGSDPRVALELVILARSPDVPENGLALRKDLDPSVREKLREVLLAMHTDPEGKNVLKKFGATRFIHTANRDYETIYLYAREIGLDLARYDYVNE